MTATTPAEAIEHCNRWISEHVSELGELTSELLKFDTRSVDLTGAGRNTNQEGAAQGYIREYLDRLGFAVAAVEPDPSDYADHPMMPSGHHWQDRSMTLAHLPSHSGDGLERSLALNGHLDVVEVGERDAWRHDPFGGSQENGRVYGRGASDMKGGIAAAMFAVAALRNCGVELAADVWVQIVTDEETSGMGMVAMADHAPKPSAAVFAECTGFTIMGSCRGVLLGRVELAGHAAHAEMPASHSPAGSGVNAIDKLPVLFAALSDLNKRWATKHHPLLSHPRAIPTIVSAGDSAVTLSDQAEVTLDVTYLPADADADGFGSKVKAELEAELTAHAATDPWLVEHPPVWTWYMDFPPHEVGDISQLTEALTASIAPTGRTTEVVGLDSWHDAATAGGKLGIPAVSFGPGDPDLAHTVDESIGLDELTDGARALAALMINYCDIAQP
jgi:acetylornithine deacetylase